jgi:hypothetical protein
VTTPTPDESPHSFGCSNKKTKTKKTKKIMSDNNAVERVVEGVRQILSGDTASKESIEDGLDFGKGGEDDE